MIYGCMARLVPLCLIGVVVLWFFRAPESVAGLIVGVIGLIGQGADAVGRFATALTPAFSALL